MKAKIKLFQLAFPQKVVDAMEAELPIELAEAQRKCPVDVRPKAPHPGALRDSGKVEVSMTPKGVQGTISFGGLSLDGTDVDYAVPVHEDLEAHHEVGEAKFLESTIDESKPYLLQRIGARLAL